MNTQRRYACRRVSFLTADLPKWTFLKPFTKVTAPLGSIAQACRFKACRAYQLVASVISLATSFYVSHKSSSRAHFAAPRFKIVTTSLGHDFVFLIW